jgi:predicted signal transduction protein with EAL and GGDEF domain
MEVVAEGVENLQQLNELQSAFCDCDQGHLFSKALSADAVPGVLATNLRAELEAGSQLAAGAGRQVRDSVSSGAPPAIEGTRRTSSPSWNA